MLGSVTVLPALLSWLGDRIERGPAALPEPARQAQAAERQRRAPAAVDLGRGAAARPGRAGAVRRRCGASRCWRCAAPALGHEDRTARLDKQLPAGRRCAVGYGGDHRDLPGRPRARPQVVVKADDIDAPSTRALADFKEQARHRGQFGKDVEHDAAPQGRTSPRSRCRWRATAPTPRRRRPSRTLRDELVPARWSRSRRTARPTWAASSPSSIDFNDQLKQRHRAGLRLHHGRDLPADAGLLPLARRSPLTSIVLNLLSVGAAYGVMTAVFQHGWGAELLGTEAVGAIESWMPLFVLVVLFGLSMDYHVFVVSRIREAHDRGVRTREAIREGIRAHGGCGHRRGGDHGRGLRGLRHAVHAGHAADGHRPRGRGAAGRDARTDGAAARGDGAARRAQLVSAALAAVAARSGRTASPQAGRCLAPPRVEPGNCRTVRTGRRASSRQKSHVRQSDSPYGQRGPADPPAKHDASLLPQHTTAAAGRVALPCLNGIVPAGQDSSDGSLVAPGSRATGARPGELFS